MYQPCYAVNDWGALGYFIGDNHVWSAWGTHSINNQTDYRIRKPFRAMALFPDGSEEHVYVHQKAYSAHVDDHGHSSVVHSFKHFVIRTVNGIDAHIDASMLKFDLSTVEDI